MSSEIFAAQAEKVNQHFGNLRHFQQLRVARTGHVLSWKMRCPVHQDRRPSLFVDIARDGKILVHCFSGCTTDSICGAAGIELRELFAEGTANEGTNGNQRAKAQIVAEYDYTDEQGYLLYQVVRYEPKDFRLRKPDGNGGSTWNLGDVRRVLYRLPELITARDLLIVEGEKDVETARQLGFVASCNFGGAGKWRPEYSEVLRGKRVAIIADADHPGRKHAQSVAASLFCKAESIKVIELPGAKDFSECVEQGGNWDSLTDLISKARQWEPTTPHNETRQGGFRLTPLRDLITEPEEDVSWLLEDRLPAGGLSILSAKPKVGKSTFARCLCLAVARGDTFLGCRTKQGPVIYLALEEKRSEVARHFRDLGASEEEIYIHAASAPQDAVSELCEVTKRILPVLVTIDPLFKFVRIRDEKAYAEVCKAIEPLLTLARDTGAHVMLSHHNGKIEKADATDAILGSTAIFGAVDSAIILKKTERYRTIQSSQRYGTDWPELVLKFDPDARRISLGEERSVAEADRVADAILAYLGKNNEPQTRVQIESGVGGQTAPLRKALKALCVAGRVSESGTGTKGDPFHYKPSPSVLDARNGSWTSVNSCSHIYAGTGEQGSPNTGETHVNAEEMLVPDVSQGAEHVTQSREQEFCEGKL